jgi:hypothetical protein
LVLEVDDDAGPGSGSGSGSGAGSGGGTGGGPAAGSSSAPAPAATSDATPGRSSAYEPEDEYDTSAFAEAAPDPGDQAKEAEARLLQAFPGASEVTG